MSTEQDSITDEPDDTPRAPPQMPQPSKLDRDLMSRGRQRIPQPPSVPKSRIIERAPVDFAGGAVKSTPTSNGYDPLGFARVALDESVKDWDAIREAAGDVEVDSISLSRFAKTLFDRSIRRLEEAERKADERRTQQSTEVSSILRMKVSDHRAGEIRSHFKSQGKSAFATMHAALMDSNDYETVSAILQAPPYLSGLTREQQGKFETLAEMRLCPEGCAERDQAAKARDLLKAARERMQTQIGAKLPLWSGETGALKKLRLAAERI